MQMGYALSAKRKPKDKVEVLSLSPVLWGKTGEMPALRVPVFHSYQQMQGRRRGD